MKSLKDPDMTNTVDSVEVDVEALIGRFLERAKLVNGRSRSEAKLFEQAASALQASEAARLKAEGERDAREADFLKVWPALQQFAHDTGAMAGQNVIDWFSSHTDTLRARWKVQDELFAQLQAAELRASKAEEQRDKWRDEFFEERSARMAANNREFTAEEQRKALVEALQMVLSCDREALANHRPKGGIADCIDNAGTPYQSAYLGKALDKARAALSETADQALPKDEGWVKRLINRLNPRDGMISVSVPALELALSEALPAPPTTPTLTEEKGDHE
jgi:hypothetical protein